MEVVIRAKEATWHWASANIYKHSNAQWLTVKSGQGSGTRHSWPQVSFHRSLAEWPWARCLTSPTSVSLNVRGRQLIAHILQIPVVRFKWCNACKSHPQTKVIYDYYRQRFFFHWITTIKMTHKVILSVLYIQWKWAQNKRQKTSQGHRAISWLDCKVCISTSMVNSLLGVPGTVS